ncbi:MAG TPA: hypothetical protein VK627_05310 [Edaphobacter sp.]|nr:hypothetical protein [Edaphobacter sp.]
MKIGITTAALVLAAVPAVAQNAHTGVSNPDSVVITTTDDTAPATQAPAGETGRHALTAKPSAGTPATAAPAAAPASSEVYGAYVPYKGATMAKADEPGGDVDVDGQIVTSVPEREGELREGTLLRVEMQEGLSTSSTLPGTKFTTQVVEAVEKDGRVIIPIGSILDGQVTEVHGGRRIAGGAALHLEPRSVTLPDGTHYVVHAQLIDTTRSDFNVDREGTLKRRDRAKETLAVMSLATGSGAVAGAMIGGGVGAVVGAGVGAGVSTVMWLKQDRQATLKKDAGLVFSLTTPMILTPLSNGPVSRVGGGDGLMGGAGAAQ